MVRKILFFAKFALIFCISSFIIFPLQGQIIKVGEGSYTTTFPGVDAAGRNTYPSGTPMVTGNALNKPIPTNDWWSLKLKSDHVSNLFSYPTTLKTVNSGLVLTYIPWGVIDDQEPLIVGVTALNASRANVSDFSDWTVTMNWSNGGHSFTATAGIAMPFVYFNKNGTDVAQITVNAGTVTISNEMLVIENVRNGADFAVYAPSGSVWEKNGKVYTSTLNGKNYWSVAHLPSSATSVQVAADTYKKYAYVFPINTTTSWSYNESTSVVRTDFTITPDIKEGEGTTVLQGLLPHQWNNLAFDSPVPAEYSYTSVRGEIKTLAGNSFSVENTFYGILPTLPYVDNYSEGFSPSELNKKIQSIENDGLSTWTDSYNEGQVMNRLIQTARIADLTGNTAARDKMLATVKERLEDWLSYETGEVAFLFYYNTTWSAMIGYPAGHGQDGNLNDHHFHWGYFIHAAAFLEQFEPGWAGKWGEMINLLVRDAASPNREDEKFPFLRNYSPYAGHCWANGFATFPQGNDQESTSESMQFNSSLIHWGTVTGNDEIRNLGIYLYTTEQTAIEEYWFDMYERNFSPQQKYSLVSRVWGNSYDNGTFWTSDIAASYGIEMYPIHGGSLYLGHNQAYVEKLWNEITVNTGILSNQANDNLWHDVMWEYLAFIDPEKAIELYDSYPERNLKFGISDAQTYYWLHAMNVLGGVNANVTANHPIAAVFEKDGKRTYTAHNYSNEPVSVTFSDGFVLEVPANSMASSKDIALKGKLTSLYNQAFSNGNAELTVEVSGGAASKIEIYDGNSLIAEINQEPYMFNATNLQAGVHGFYAKVFDGEDFAITNILSFVVGRQLPFTGSAFNIPGIIEPGYYNKFEGGTGQGIAYNDASQNNEGGFRPNEYVDATENEAEGAVVGWISSGEWMNYTINVQEPGLYNLSFRYASGNSSGGGPFHLELDGEVISNPITVSSTNGWEKWATKTVNDIPLKKGEHILRLAFSNGEFNLGKMTFAYSAPLPYTQPVADAGKNVTVLIPETTASLNGTQSTNPGTETLTYHWAQVYGPSVIAFSDANIATPDLSALVEGIYNVKLTVSNGSYSDSDEVLVIVSANENISPTVSIISPVNKAEFIGGKMVTILAEASDLDGTIKKVDFFEGVNLIGTSLNTPYSIQWTSGIGEYSITAVATDNEGAIATSHATSIVLTQAPSCEGVAHNGDFKYRFSDDAKNPTITFIPSVSGVGSPTCIFYYSTSASGPFPGFNVTPNTPFRINADEGKTIYFYYTYSYPGQGEKNTADKPSSYVIGSCATPTGVKDLARRNIIFYPNPAINELSIVSELQISTVEVRNLMGQLVKTVSTNKLNSTIDLSDINAGNYIVSVILENGERAVQKIVKL
jgi:endoglucanase Acf2